MPVPSSILWQNETKTIVLLDLPRSLEEAQVPSRKLGTSPLRRIVSAQPLAIPFSTPEPRRGGTLRPSSSSTQVSELMTRGYVDAALGEISSSHTGPWCLDRVIASPASPEGGPEGLLHAPTTGQDTNDVIIPEEARYHLGTIDDGRAEVMQEPPFHLIVLDPPWPNHSARRKKGGYQVADDFAAVRELLFTVPITSHLCSDGLLGVWITNAPRVSEMLTSAGGIFAGWGVELVDEWTWLKVTAHGDPVVSLDSEWRKPWERLLIAARPGRTRVTSGQRKVIFSVPDTHSRKPNLRGLLEPLMPPDYRAMEVFARNLTAGWTAWGNQVLHFQHRRFWAAMDDGGDDTRVEDGENDANIAMAI
ncbi:hypothetical protein P8C59_000748 [Phyllachora maydis]|uniref:MT-A70-domain-containing protein n=1 Tax=Phyllachora maydis TaxID=1825666 RepID=A0AAD9HWW1_9PEZI|nr:hypothetical protein P8C59_000748 [Phyllachora maydis]